MAVFTVLSQDVGNYVFPAPAPILRRLSIFLLQCLAEAYVEQGTLDIVRKEATKL